jgi:hypothetical protein
MPLTATSISSSIKGFMALVGFNGRDMGKIADSVGNAVFMHLSIPNAASATVSGTVGPIGSITNISVQGIVPTVMKSLMEVKGASSGFTGRDLGKLSQAISMGLSTQLMTMVFNGSAIGLAIGGGTAKFTSINVNALGSLLKVALAGVGFTGRDLSKLADMVATGVVQHLQTSATFPVVATGAIAPVPPTGPLAAVGIPSVFSKIS